MKIEYTSYAEETLRERKINQEDIERVFHDPEKIFNGKKGRMIVQKRMGEKLLRVIFENNTNTYIVITGYYTKPTRYQNENKF